MTTADERVSGHPREVALPERVAPTSGAPGGCPGFAPQSRVSTLLSSLPAIRRQLRARILPSSPRKDDAASGAASEASISRAARSGVVR